MLFDLYAIPLLNESSLGWKLQNQVKSHDTKVYA